MERLTNRNLPMNGYLSNSKELRNYLDRVAAYEDTGLAPEEILTGKELAEIAIGLQQLNRIRSVFSDKRMEELMQAEKEGRLVVLPCKVGDKVWYLTGKPSAARQPRFDRIDSEIVGGFYYDERGLQVRLNYFHGNHGTYGFFGKTVFLTREEAQEALKEREDRP